MRVHALRNVCILAGLAGAALFIAAAAAAEPVKVAKEIAFSSESDARDKVKTECALQTKVPAFLAESSSDVTLVEGDLGTSGRVLELEITEAHAPGGGAFSGPKILSVKGVLRENGTEIGNFLASRYSTGGAFGAYKGTCAIIGRCAKAVGQDIAAWLKSPSKDAKLGDAK